MTPEEKLAQVLGEAHERHQFKTISLGIARSVTDEVCDVERSDDDVLFDVRLHGVEDTLASFIRIKPKEGSVVIVGILENIKTEACIIQCSEIDEVLIKIGTMEFRINSTGIEMNGGQLKGLVKLDALVTKINAIESSLNGLKSVFTGWAPVPSDGGAALKTAVGSWAGQQITTTTANDLENPNIKQ